MKWIFAKTVVFVLNHLIKRHPELSSRAACRCEARLPEGTRRIERRPESRDEGRRWNSNILKIKVLVTIILLSLGLLTSCDKPEPLKAVSGIEGEIEIQGDMPDSIKAVVLAVFDTDIVDDQENISDYLISFSDPITQTADYSIQLKPDHYIGVLVGLLIDPGVFVANIDQYLESPELPLVQLSEFTVGGIFVKEDVMSTRDWEVKF